MPFTFDALTEFNPAIIYTQRPEAVRGLDPTDSNTVAESIIASGLQIEGYYNGYVHLQNNALKHIQKNGTKSITPKLIETWMKTFHYKASHQLAVMSHCEKLAGVFNKAQVFSWNHYDDFRKPLLEHFSYKTPKALFIAKAHENTGESIEDIAAFYEVLISMKDRKKLYPHAKLLLDQHKDSEFYEYSYLIDKLTYAYHENELTTKQIATVRKFVKLCLPPHKIEPVITAFYESLANLWKKTNPESLEEIIHLAAFAFNRHLDIHPFFNANKRTAGALMNLILRSFNQPSIVLFHSKSEIEEFDSSEAGKAVDALPDNIEPFKALLKKRILEANIKPFSDSEYRLIKVYRINLAKKLNRLKNIAPELNASHYVNAFTNKYFSQYLQISDVLSKTIDDIDELIQAKQKEKQESKPVKTPTPITPDKLIEYFAKKLETSNRGWKPYRMKTGNPTLIYTPQSTSFNIDNAMRSIKSWECCQVKIQLLSKTKQRVLVIDKINTGKILGKSKLSDKAPAVDIVRSNKLSFFKQHYEKTGTGIFKISAPSPDEKMSKKDLLEFFSKKFSSKNGCWKAYSNKKEGGKMNLIFKSNKTEEMSRIYDELSSSSFCDVSQRKLAVTSEPILLIQNINHYKILLDHNVDNFLSMLSSLS